MNHKITFALVIACLSFQGCTKKEPPEHIQAIQPDSETKADPDTQSIEQGKKAIESNGLDEFQMELNRNAPNGHSYVALSADQVKFLGKEPDGLYTYTWKLRFQETATGNIMGCDSDKVSWNKDSNEILVSLASKCFNVLEQGNVTPTAPEYKLSYRIDSKSVDIGSRYITVYDLVIASESDDPVNISYISRSIGGIVHWTVFRIRTLFLNSVKLIGSESIATRVTSRKLI